MTTHRFVHRLHPALTWVLNGLEGSALGQSLTDRLTELLSHTLFDPAPDYEQALRAHLWTLKRASDPGFTLTAAGYLKPADVKELAAVLPEMTDWIFAIGREIDSYPVFSFREYLKEIRLLRKYKGTLLATRLGKNAAEDPVLLWQHLADTLIPTDDDFVTAASVLVLAHTATEQGERIDMHAIARALSELGWKHRDGSQVSVNEVWPVANNVWSAVGNVGARESGTRRERVPSVDAVRMIRDTLFEEVNPEGSA